MKTENGFDKRKRLFKRWYHWRPAKGTCCPRRVAGNRCLRFEGSRPWPRCLCERSGQPLLDHTAMWRDEQGQLVFTTEPYHADQEHLSAYAEQLRLLGLQLTILPRSGWYEGNTILLAVTRQPIRDTFL